CDRKEFPALPAEIATRPDREALIELNAIVTRACQFDPAQRYVNSEAMLAELELVERGRSVKRKRGWEQRRALFGRVLLGALLLGVLATGGIFLSQPRHSRVFHSKVPGVDTLVERGNEILRRSTPEGLAKALDCFNQAAQKDPKFPPALIGIWLTRLLQFA